MFFNPFSVKKSRLTQLSAYFDRGDKLRFVRFVLISQLPALMELAVAAIIALVAAVFSSSEKVAEYAPIAYLIKHTGFTFLNDQRYLAFALLIALWAAMLLKNVTNMLQAYMGAMFAENCSRKLTLRIMQFFLRAPWHWHLTKGVVDLNFSFNSAGQMGVLLTTISQAIANASVIIFLFVGLLVAAPGLSLGLFGVAGLSALCIVHGIKRYFDSLNSSIYAKQLEMSRASYFALHGMKEARLHCREDAIYEDYKVRSQGLMRANALRTALSRLPVSLIESIAFLMLPLMMYMLLEVQGASMTRVVAIMGFLAGAAWRVLPAVNRLVDNAMQLRTFTPYLNNVLDRLQEEEGLRAQIIAPSVNAVLPFERELRVNNITYTYPKSAEPALVDLSMTVAKGTMVGIVGLSGAGKSTLVAVLTGLLQPSQGDITLDGCLLSPNLYAAWRKKLGYVPQSPFIFNDTIAANIALSDWGGTVDRERVHECCKLAALDFVADLKDGIDALVGDRGMRLSGGQTQRLAIARALYDKPEVLIFDEATSSLDIKNERAIHDTVLTLRSNITMIIIAHRLSTVEDCDSIVWLEKGRVKVQGEASNVLSQYQATMQTVSPQNDTIKDT
ncbi:MAG: ABC transporter ATP-binding protein [Desulfovibrionaceae bacterium]